MENYAAASFASEAACIRFSIMINDLVSETDKTVAVLFFVY
jgi:hypothetical protein